MVDSVWNKKVIMRRKIAGETDPVRLRDRGYWDNEIRNLPAGTNTDNLQGYRQVRLREISGKTTGWSRMRLGVIGFAIFSLLVFAVLAYKRLKWQKKSQGKL